LQRPSGIEPGHPIKAVKAPVIVVAQASENVAEFQQRAAAFKAANKYDLAVREYRKALLHNPTGAHLHEALGHCLAKLGQERAARNCFKLALHINPRAVYAYRGLMRYEGVAPDAPAVNILREVAHGVSKSLSSRAVAYFTLGHIFMDAGQDDLAFEYFRCANRLRIEKIRKEDGPAARFSYSSTTFQHALTPDLLSSCKPEYSGHTPSILVTGLPRSGKTIVESLLARHPQIAAGGEMGLVSGFARQLDQTGGPAFVASAVTKRSSSPVAAGYLAALLELDKPTASYIVDTSPAHVRELGLYAMMHPQAPIILCHKAPQDLGASLFFKEFKHGHHWSYGLESVGTAIAKVELLMAHWCEVLPNPIFRVQYEDLVRNPRQIAQNLFAFLGLDPQAAESVAEQRQPEGPIDPAHTKAVIAPSPDLIGFASRFRLQLAPMMAAYRDALASKSNPSS
jgi:tetratricopeptide (TPR) repeat protein